MVGDEGADETCGLQRLLERDIGEHAQDGPEQGAGAAEHRHHDRETGLVPGEELWRHETVDTGEQGARQPREGAGDDEGGEFELVDVVAERRQPRLVRLQPLHDPSERRACEPEQREHAGDEQREADVVEGRAVVEIDERRRADREIRLDHDVGAVRPLGDVGVVEQREHHLRGGERHHDEIEAAREADEGADQKRRDGRARHARAERDEDVGGFRFRRNKVDGIGADAEEGRVAETDEAREAENEVETDDEDREDDHPGREFQSIGADIGRQGEKQRAQKREHDQCADGWRLQHVTNARTGRSAAARGRAPSGRRSARSRISVRTPCRRRRRARSAASPERRRGLSLCRR